MKSELMVINGLAVAIVVGELIALGVAYRHRRSLSRRLMLSLTLTAVGTACLAASILLRSVAPTTALVLTVVAVLVFGPMAWHTWRALRDHLGQVGLARNGGGAG